VRPCRRQVLLITNDHQTKLTPVPVFLLMEAVKTKAQTRYCVGNLLNPPVLRIPSTTRNPGC